MYDETQLKIIDATMTLIIEKGYSGTTTKNIACLAGVNECTIFRRFSSKKDIILAAMELPRWNPCLPEEDFIFHGDLISDLISFSKVYMSKVTPEMVKVSIGLRTTELQGAALQKILKVPMICKKVLIEYFLMMQEKGFLKAFNIESAALQFIALNFGFVFLDASFGKQLIGIEKAEYIENSVALFVNGIGIK